MLRAMNTQTQVVGGPRAWWTAWLAFWRRRPRALRWTLWALLIAYAAYLVLGNLFLNTALEPMANRRPDAFQAQWGRAYTLFPGHVVARDVRLHGQTRHIEWQVQAQRASGRLALLPLLKKEVRIPEVVATGVSGGARHTERNREPPPPREGGWTMVFERIVSDSLRRGYMDEVVLEGNGRASFGFSKQLRGGPMEIFPSRFHFDRARVLADGEQVLERGSLGGNFAIRRHSREQAMGLQKLLLSTLQILVRLPQSVIGTPQFADRPPGENHPDQLAGSRQARRAIQRNRQRSAVAAADQQLAILDRRRPRCRKEVASPLP